MTEYTTSGIICIDKKAQQFLMMKSKFNDKKWSFPKGYIEKNESPLNSALRELYEETHIQLSENDLSKYTYDLKLVMNKPTRKIPSGIKNIHFYVVFIDSSTPITLSREHSEFTWTSNLEKLKNINQELLELSQKIKSEMFV